jgi:hypothetical protein
VCNWAPATRRDPAEEARGAEWLIAIAPFEP